MGFFGDSLMQYVCLSILQFWYQFNLNRKTCKLEIFICVQDNTFLNFGLGQLKSFMFILRYVAISCKPTILKAHPPISGIKAHGTTQSRLEHSFISFWSKVLIQMNSAWKIVSSVGHLNPGPFSHEPSAY